MTPDAITLENIRKDLTAAAEAKRHAMQEWRMTYILPLVTIAAIIGFVLWAIDFVLWLPALAVCLAPAGYHIFYHVRAGRECKREKRLIEGISARKDLAITVEALSHIATETVYEPYMTQVSHKIRLMKNIIVFHFAAGGRFRLPALRKHYAWSREYCLSSTGLWQTSVEGNEFYVISLQGHPDIRYIYPKKFFKLSASLS